MSRDLLTVERGEVWTVRLDRPAQANALSAELVEALHRVLGEVEQARPRVLVLRGGERHFAAGFDLGGLAEETDASLAHRFLRIGLLLERLAELPCTTVAVAEGAAVGAGADLVLACDHRLGDPSVTLRFPGPAFGVALGAVRREALAGAWVTGTPASLPDVLRQLEDAASPSRGADPDRTADADLATLARSLAVPGLHARLTAYAATVRRRPTTPDTPTSATRVKEHA